MNFFKRAFISIKRSIGKTLLLFLLIIVLGSVISGAISANQATETTERHLRNSMLPVAMIEFDWAFHEIMEEEGIRVSWVLPPDYIREVGALPYVSYFDFAAETGLFGRDLEPYEPEMDDDMWGGGMWVDPTFGPQFRLRGVHDPAVFDIQAGLIELVEGRVFNDIEVNNLTNVALISQNFAEVNNLRVGSTFSLRNAIIDWGRLHDEQEEDGRWQDPTEDHVFADESYDLEVIGIFRPLVNPDTGNQWDDHHIIQEFENRIYTSNVFVEMVNRFANEAHRELHPEWFEEMDDEEDEMFYRNTFILNDPADLRAFQDAANEIIPEQFMVVVQDNAFQDVEAALTSIGQLTATILWVAVGAALLILTLLIMLFLRDRRREIGIYLALGEKRGKITTQIIMEIMLVAFAGIVIALFIGNLIAGNMSETMLMNDLAARAQAADPNMWVWDPFAWAGFTNEVDVDSIIESYRVALTPMTVLMFFGVGLGTTFLATVIPIFYVTRLNPKKIML